MLFIQGATLAHYTGDREAKRAEVAAGLAAFDDEFLAASLARRRAAIDEVARGTLSEDALPHDVLTTLLRHDDELHLAPDVVLREICFFLLAGAHTSATAFVRTLHHVFELAASSPADAQRVRTDPVFLQRCVHETIRLQPSSPIAMRWALEDVELPGGVTRAERGAPDDRPDVRQPRPRGVRRRRRSIRPAPRAARRRRSLGAQLRARHARLHRRRPGRRPRSGRRRSPTTTWSAWSPSRSARSWPQADDPTPTSRPTLDPESARGYWGQYPVLFAT